MSGFVIAGRYELERLVASGGMGEVWRARDRVLGRTVAVKLLKDELMQDGRATQRFRREAMTAASITHPRMANVYDYVDVDGCRGIVMEYVEGETLADRLAREGRIGQGEAGAIARAVLEALEVAHASGIIHRDIKPGNILLGANGDVKVADFGIARALGDSTVTGTGSTMGTPHYIAPELVQGAPASPASDLYAVGAVLYEMLTGCRPFDGDTPIAIALARMQTDPVPPRLLDRSIPPWLEHVVLRALARDPSNRFPAARAMHLALSERGVPVPTSMLESRPSDDTVELAVAPADHAPRPRSTRTIAAMLRPWIIPAAAIVLLAAFVSLPLLTSAPDRARAHASQPRVRVQPVTAAPTPTPQPKPATVQGAVAALIAVVKEGDRRGEIDADVAKAIIEDARDVRTAFSGEDDIDEAVDQLRDIAETMSDAVDDGEIRARRADRIDASLRRLARLILARSDESD